MEINSNILNFPPQKNKIFQHAIEEYKSGNLKNALELCLSLINKRDKYVNTLAGAIYERGGNGVQQDFNMALFYYQQAVDEVGSLEGWLALGRFHYFGKGIPQDYEKAFYYYSVVAEDAENAVAYLMLGRMYLEGTGVAKNILKAREYLKKAIEKKAVFGYTYLAMLEKECGHVFRSLLLRATAGFMAWYVTHHDPNDSRLRRY